MLRELIGRRLGLADESVRLRREEGFDAARAALAAGPTEQVLSGIDAHLAAMKGAETELLARRKLAADGAAHGTFVASAPVELLALAALVAMIVSGRRSTTELERRILERTHELTESNRALRMLSDCNQGLIRATDEASLAQTVCDVVVREGGHRFSFVAYAEHDEAKTLRIVARAGLGADRVAFATTWADVEGGQTASGLAIRTGRRVVLDDLADDPELVSWRTEIRRLGLSTAAALPLEVGGVVLGVLVVLSTEPAAFDEPSLVILDELAKDLAFGVGTLRNRAAHEALEARYASVLDGMMEGAQVVDFAWTYRYLNAVALTQARKPPEELLGHTMMEAYPGIEHTDLFGTLRTCMESRLPQRIENRFDYPDGSAGYFELNVTAVPEGLFLLSHDVTEKHRSDEELRANQERFSSLVSGLNDVVWTTSADGSQVLDINNAFERVYGRSAAEYQANPRLWLETVHPEDRGIAAKSGAQLCATGEASAEYRIVRPDGAVRWLLDRKSILGGVNSAERRLGGVATDITERKVAEEHLREVNANLERRVAERTAEAESANRSKSAFLANMSHEIRTPMNAVLGFAQLLQRDLGLTAPQQRQVSTIVRAGENLLSLLTQILDYSKLEAGRIVLDEGPFDLHALLDDLAAMFRMRIDEKGLRLVVEHGDGAQHWVVGDEPKLRQIVQNLLSNAVKFTEHGGVSVRAAVGPGPGGPRLVVEVEDSGTGIEPEELGRLFRVFEQTESGRRAKTGTGLGLAISRGFAELLGGTLGVTSQPGNGSTFRLEVPVQEGEALTVPQHVARPRVTGLEPGQALFRVLVADDIEDNRSFLAALLVEVGFEVRQACDGAAAVAEFESWGPHLILMDMRMPVMTGAEAIVRIRAQRGGAAVKIVVVTANAFREDEAQAIAAGADDCLTEPYRADVLFEKIQALLGVRYVLAEAEPPETPEARRSLAPVLRAQAAALPGELVSALREASLSADLERILELADAAEAHGLEVGRELRRLAEGFDYGKLLALLETGAEA